MRVLTALSVAIAIIATAARAGEARCWFENGAVVVPAAFGDIAGDFIVDVSAPKSQLHLTRAEGDGIDLAGARGALVIAGERLPGFQIEIADLDAKSRAFPTVINGVIGADVLQHFIADLSFTPCRLTLHRRARGRLAGAVRLAVRRTQGVPAVEAAISDGHFTRRGWFAIDTASSAAKIAEATLSRPIAPGEQAAGRTRLRALSIAGRLFETLPAGLEDVAQAGLSGAIGSDVWARFRMRLDLKDDWLELAPVR